MSTETENQDLKETPTSGESCAAESGDASGEAAATSGSSSVAVSEELMAKIVDLCAKNSEATININKKIQDLSSKLESINSEIESKKPLRFEGEVTGFYNYDTKQKEVIDEYYIGQKEKARQLFSRARSKYPTS